MIFASCCDDSRFSPFEFIFRNGQTYDVPHPELGYLMRATMIVAKPAADTQYVIGDGMNIVSILHINNIEMLSASTAKGNGSV